MVGRCKMSLWAWVGFSGFRRSTSTRLGSTTSDFLLKVDVCVVIFQSWIELISVFRSLGERSGCCVPSILQINDLNTYSENESRNTRCLSTDTTACVTRSLPPAQDPWEQLESADPSSRKKGTFCGLWAPRPEACPRWGGKPSRLRTAVGAHRGSIAI